ncbi:phage tail protein [Pseudomonas sp. AE27]|uniref:phage tail protein n=1 Tax=Pseudomonas sp. AE27 TaxID=3127460 RepID=UPI0030D15834
MAWSRAGTVSVTKGSTTVTGVNADFAANSRVGDAFIGPDGILREVTNVASATVLSIFPAYSGATATGAAYALVPVQGYVKQLADQARQIIQQWGGTLAGLGAVSTEDVVPVAKGGTGAKTPAEARTALGLKSAASSDVVGTVSAVGGAIIERGSNANGDYTKFADGTLEGWITSSNSQSIPNNSGIEISVTYPATFVGTPTITGSAGLATSGTTGLAARVAVGFPFAAPGLSSARVHIFNTTGITIGGFSYFIKIKGRWR